MLHTPLPSSTLVVREANDHDCAEAANIVAAAYRHNYRGMITREQIEHTITTLFSSEALLRQRRAGHLLLMAYYDGKPAAFMAFEASGEDANEILIHSLYLLPNHQGRGLGRLLIDEVERRATALGRGRVVMSVNRLAIQAINFAFRNGFFIRSVVDIDIGRGFCMRDFVMEKRLGLGESSGRMPAMR